jgi:folate-binding protein YgfZ
MKISPLEPFFDKLEAAYIPFGPSVRVPGEIDAMELEYASIRKAAAMLDCPFRGLIRLTGADRLTFLNRLVTHDLRAMTGGGVRRCFLLTAQGRIMADLTVAHFDDHTLIDLDAHQVSAVAKELDKLLFGEDVTITDLSESHHRVSLLGPKAQRAAEWWTHVTQGEADHWMYEQGQVGERGFHLWAPAGSFARIESRHLELRETFDLRPIGWLAYNVARIEAGEPMFNIDFGVDSLPHETGLMSEAVSFTKGCYRGQEIVARMENLGHPAKLLVGFKGEEAEVVPVSGVAVYSGQTVDTPIVGAVTSSTFSPLLGNVPIGFAMVKWAHRPIGTRLWAPAEGRNVPIVVHGLQFLPIQTSQQGADV